MPQLISELIEILQQGEKDKLFLRDSCKSSEAAQNELGTRYDIRAFHDEILNGGALPLDVLDARVTTWIAGQKSSKGNN